MHLLNPGPCNISGNRQHYYAARYRLLAPLLEITHRISIPQLIIAYEFGASFSSPKPPQGAGEPQRAVELMQYGIQHNPDNWHLYYDLGFVYDMDF